MVGGCPCGFWAVSNCRYLREVALMCRTKDSDRPALPSRVEVSR